MKYRHVFGLLGLLVAAAQLGQAQPRPERQNSKTLKTLAQDNNEFACDLFARLAPNKSGNMVFAPFSISTTLAMTYASARGKTAKEMAKVLHFTLGKELLHSTFKTQFAELKEDCERRYYELVVANALWGQTGTRFGAEFLDLTLKNYGAGLKEVDFVGFPDKARDTINQWVEENTKGKIKELLQKENVSPLTRLVLTNAVYFKAAWEKPFNKKNTKDAPFELNHADKIVVPMMSQEGAFSYFVDDDFQWLELPYSGQSVAMVVLLPRKKEDFAKRQNTVTASTIVKGVQGLRPRKGRVELPRFKANCRYCLNEDLPPISAGRK